MVESNASGIADHGLALRFLGFARADAVWLALAALASFAFGIAADRLLRPSPVGLHFRATRHLSLPSTVEAVTAEEVAQLFANPAAIALDARPHLLFDLGHLPGARSLSRENFEKDYSALEPVLRSAVGPLILYCSDIACEDAARVVELLQQKGLSSLVLFAGGIAEWEAAGHPLEVTP